MINNIGTLSVFLVIIMSTNSIVLEWIRNMIIDICAKTTRLSTFNQVKAFKYLKEQNESKDIYICTIIKGQSGAKKRAPMAENTYRVYYINNDYDLIVHTFTVS